MIETLKHILGICGEHWHPNIWTFLAGGVGLSPAFYYIKGRIKLHTPTKVLSQTKQLRK